MWIETVLLVESAATVCLSALNVTLLAGELRRAPGRARRVAALVLALVCAGQAVEAAMFLAQEAPSPATGGWQGLVVVVARSLPAGSAALISILLVRAAVRR